MTEEEVFSTIRQSECEGVFDRHIDPIPADLVLPVDEHYHYPHMRTFREKVRYGLEKFFIVIPYIRYLKYVRRKTKVVGRQYLKGLKGAVLTCNHVDKFDCLAIKYATRGHRTFTVAAPFNNMKGFLGEMMRAGDMLPMSEKLVGQKHFLTAVRDVLQTKKAFLTVYPEASMWRYYPKPRPYKDGAFQFAVQYNVPVVPQFITYRTGKKKEKDGSPRLYFTLHICAPVYPRQDLTKKENIAYLRDAAYAAAKEVYEAAYGIPLAYTCNDEKAPCPVFG